MLGCLLVALVGSSKGSEVGNALIVALVKVLCFVDGVELGKNDGTLDVPEFVLFAVSLDGSVVGLTLG